MTTRANQWSTPLTRRIEVLQAAIRTEIEGKTVVRVMGFALTAAQIQARLGVLELLYEGVQATRGTELEADALATYCAAVRRVKLFIRHFEAALKAQIGVDNPKLRLFGISTARGKLGRRRALRRAYRAAITSRARRAGR